MKKNYLYLFFLLCLFNLLASPRPVKAQPAISDSARLAWFGNARLGIFIHWGIYAVDGIGESWSFYNGYISHDDYMKQLRGFTAEKYNPAEWARLIKESGARYAVITTKHHDGVALWDSKFGDLNVVKKTPAARDLIRPFVESLRKENLKVGLYYSLLDWSHPDYPNFTKKVHRYEKDSTRWAKFVTYNMGQIGELMDSFHPDLLWFDGDWEQSAEQWHARKIRELILKKNKNAIINSRLQGYGDYATPEQGLPIHQPTQKYWELCMTMNDSWGYQGNDKAYKTPFEIIRIFSDVISQGGNLLLDIGPRPDGIIPDEQVHILKELGKWTKKHDQAIFGTQAGIPRDYFAGPSTLSPDKKMLYLFVSGKPTGPVMLKGIKNNINSIWVVGKGTHLNHTLMMKAWWSQVPGLIFIDVPEDVVDEYMTVIAVSLDGEVDLYESNKQD